MCLNAKGGGGRIDGESETFVVANTLKANNGGGGFGSDPNETFLPVTHALRADGFDASEDGTGRGTPLVPVGFRASGQDGFTPSEACPPILSTDGGGAGVPTVAYPIQEVGKRTGTSTDDPRAGIGIGEDGDPMFTLQAGARHGVAAYAFQPRIARNGRGDMGDVVNALNAQSDETNKDDAAPYMTAGIAVRRLTPTECSRLQGFPDDYLLSVTWRGKCPPPDGPMYKALGNSMAVPVMRWIGSRIAEELEKSTEAAA
jgi:DNA (cytosine-5)-methyltransferase 1